MQESELKAIEDECDNGGSTKREMYNLKHEIRRLIATIREQAKEIERLNTLIDGQPKTTKREWDDEGEDPEPIY